MTKYFSTIICGLGSIGRRHAANLRTLRPEARITVWRQLSRKTAELELPDPPVEVVYSRDDALSSSPQMALICNPAPFHVPTATALAEKGIHIFMEKPVSDSLEGLDQLIDICKNKKLVFFMAYPLRFNPALKVMRDFIDAGEIGTPLSITAEVGQYLPDWRPRQDYRTGISGRKELGGGVLLELSHELDYVQWLMGDIASVSATLATVSDLEIDVEDTADLVIEFKNGVLGRVHLDMVRRLNTRKCVVTGSAGTVEWDGISSTAKIYLKKVGKWRSIFSRRTDPNEMYLAELKHFLACVANKEEVIADGISGKRVLELILAARESSETGNIVVL